MYHSRQQHWLSYLNTHHLGDPSLSAYTLLDRNVILALYAVSLATQNNLLMMSINVKTIKAYLKAAADYALPSGLPDPHLD